MCLQVQIKTVYWIIVNRLEGKPRPISPELTIYCDRGCALETCRHGFSADLGHIPCGSDDHLQHEIAVGRSARYNAGRAISREGVNIDV
jgi:hypothetical protein